MAATVLLESTFLEFILLLNHKHLPAYLKKEMSTINNVNIVLSLLLNFIKNEINIEEIELSNNTTLNELELDGIEGVMFIKKFSSEFKVNIEAFNFENHFNEEPTDLIKSKQPITINHLEKAIKAGRLDNEILNDK